MKRQTRNFMKWINVLKEERRIPLLLAIDLLLPPYEKEGFFCTDKSLFCGKLPSNTLYLERENVIGEIDFISIIFDNRQRARFQIGFGTRNKEVPHQWVRAGALVWAKVDESIKFQWWGAKWWHLNDDKQLTLAIQKASLLSPQVITFLTNGNAGENIWESKISAIEDRKA